MGDTQVSPPSSLSSTWLNTSNLDVMVLSVSIYNTSSTTTGIFTWGCPVIISGGVGSDPKLLIIN